MFNAGKQGKAVVMAVLFFLGVIGIMGVNTNTTYAAGAVVSNVGIVNYQLLMSQHPDTAKAEEAMNAAIAQAKSDFDAQSVNMNDQDKQTLSQQFRQKLDQKQQDLLVPIHEKVMAVIKSIAEAKGLAVVVDKSSSVYGGQDITNEAGKMLTGK